MARWVMKWLGAAPCQCHSPGGVYTVSRGAFSVGGLDRISISPPVRGDSTVSPMPRAESFAIDIPEALLDDLRERLTRTRYAPILHGGGWGLGTDPTYLRELLEYWRTTFDWRAQERRLNGYPQFRMEIDGAPIHFARLRRDADRPRSAILLLHGWPYTFVELLGLAQRP